MIVGFSSCEEDITVGNLAVDMKYTDQKQSVVTGIAERVGEFQFSKSSLPLTFEIINVVELNGGSTAEVFEELKVAVYSDAITNIESDEFKESKLDTVILPAVEIEKHTGQFIVHAGNNLKNGSYLFDVKITNVSGELILKEAIILEVLPHNVFDFENFGGTPEIERVGDTPHQILFKIHDLANDGALIPGNKIHCLTSRETGFKGIFAGDSDEGERWDVEFPLLKTSSVINMDGRNATLEFALGVPGNYVITLYKN